MIFKRIVLATCGAFFLLGASECSTSSSQQASVDDLVDAFSQGCNLGPWSRAALSRASSLTTVFEKARTNATCKGAGVDSALYAAQGLQAELRALEADVTWKTEREMEEATNDLMLSISQPGIDPLVKNQLLQSYSSARFELSMARAEANFLRNPGGKHRITTGLERVSSHVRNLMTASEGLSACYRDNPSVALQLGAGIAELAGSFASPVVGLGASAVSGLLKLGVDAARSLPPAEAIYKVRRGAMPIALSCGLEAFTRDYCRAKDARQLLSVASRKSGTTLPFFQGLELQDRSLPVLYEWLDRVVNGSGNIRDPEHAKRLNDQYLRVSTAQNGRRSAEGVFQDATNNIGRTTEEDVQIAYLRRLIRDLVSIFYCTGPAFPTTCGSSLFTGFESSLKFVEKIAKERVPTDSSGGLKSYNSLDEFIDDLKIQSGDLSLISANFSALFHSRYNEMLREFREKVNVDLGSLVRDASREDTDRRSALKALQDAREFLHNYRYNSIDQRDARRDEILIQEIGSRIQRAYEVLSNPDSVSDHPREVPCVGVPRQDPSGRCYELSPAAEAIKAVFEVFKLENNNVYLPGAFQGLVRTDLVNRFNADEGPKNIEDILRLGGADLFLTMRRFKLTPAQVELDLHRSQSVSGKSLKEFRSYFTAALKTAMEDLKQAADEHSEPESGKSEAPNRSLLGQLCLLTLISDGAWPDEIDASLCEGTKVVSREAGLELSFEQLRKELAGKAFEDRVCIYEDFLRTDRIANLNLRLPQRAPSTLWQRMINALGTMISL